MSGDYRALPSGTAEANEIILTAKNGLEILQHAVRQALSNIARLKSGAARITGLRVSLRHLAIYLGHVVLGLSQRLIGKAFHRDRSTVRYICARIEDFRDVKSFDRMLDAIEAAVLAFIRAFSPTTAGAR